MKTLVLVLFTVLALNGFSQSIYEYKSCEDLEGADTNPELNTTMAKYIKESWKKKLGLPGGSVAGEVLGHSHKGRITYDKNEYGVILGRNYFVYVVIRHKSGKCKVAVARLYQEAIENGKYTDFINQYVYGTAKKVDCGCADTLKNWLENEK